MELRISNLSKTYANGVRALDDITLNIPPGMFGLLGPNGAGKSTLMRTIATLQEPDAGSIMLGDPSPGSGQVIDPSPDPSLRSAQAGQARGGAVIDVLREKDRVRRTLGYLPQEFGVYPSVSAERLLDHFAILEGFKDRAERQRVVEGLLRQTNLWDVRRERLGGYSGGMRQRFGIAVALLGGPSLIIVDEPTAGLDPAERVRFLNLLSEIGEQAVVILSTHIVEDVAELCSRMAIIDKGEILLEAEPAAAVAALRGRVWTRVVGKAELPALERLHKVICTKLLGGRTLVHVYAESSPGPEFERVEPDLEDVYFSVMAGHHPSASSGQGPLAPAVAIGAGR
jgi:ABC-type multidrug transport system ATPase subunit